MQNDDHMAASPTLTVRIPAALKRKIAARAAREHRSISGQVEHELTRAFSDEVDAKTSGSFAGLFAGRRMPAERDFREVRALLWGRLASRELHD